MKKVEEFQETQKLMDEFQEFDNKIPELENQIKENEKKAELRKTVLEQKMEISDEDKQFLNDEQIKEVISEYQKQIEEVDENLLKDNENIQKQIEENKDSKKYFRTDAHLKTITMEIEEMKKEVSKEEIDLKKKDMELQEFRMEENPENPLRWQEIYKEQDEIKNNIAELNAKIEEYTNFKEQLNSIELTLDEFKEMARREEIRVNTEIDEEKHDFDLPEVEVPPISKEKTEEDLAWEEYEKNNGYVDNKRMLGIEVPEKNKPEEKMPPKEKVPKSEPEQTKKAATTEETKPKGKEYEDIWSDSKNKNELQANKSKISEITIHPKTGTLGYKIQDEKGNVKDEELIDIDYSKDSFRSEEIYRILGDCANKLKIDVEDFYDELDPNILKVLNKTNKAQLYEYVKTVGNKEGKMPFELNYELKKMRENEDLKWRDRRNIKTVAKSVKDIENVNVTGLHPIREWVKGKLGGLKNKLLNAWDPQEMIEDGKSGKHATSVEDKSKDNLDKRELGEKTFTVKGIDGVSEVTKRTNKNSVDYEFETESGDKVKHTKYDKGIDMYQQWGEGYYINSEQINGKTTYSREHIIDENGDKLNTVINSSHGKKFKSLEIDRPNERTTMNIDYDRADKNMENPSSITLYSAQKISDNEWKKDKKIWKIDIDTGKYKIEGQNDLKSFEEIENEFAENNNGHKITGSNAEKMFNGEIPAIPNEMYEIVKQGEELDKTPHQKFTDSVSKDENGKLIHVDHKAAQEAAEEKSTEQPVQDRENYDDM